MSNESPFPPFPIPQASSPPLVPPAGETTAPAAKPARASRKPKAAKAPPAEPVVPSPPAATPRTRKPRKVQAPAAKRSPKFDLQVILRVASALKEDDMKVFEKLLGELQALSKKSRERVLTALRQVF